MDRSRRDFLKGVAVGGTCALAAGCVDVPRKCLIQGAMGYALGPKGQVRLTVPGLKEELRVFIVGDTHLTLHDERDNAYAAYYARMAQYPAKQGVFARTLARAKAEKADLVALVGDIVSFPTLANVEYVMKELEASGLNWIYTAGNHDWHFEGCLGSDLELRAEWTQRRLTPLYRGRNPLMASTVVKGVRFVTIDDSCYHITRAQLDFWESEAGKGDPTVLLMHVPLWVEGFGLFTCGNPQWGANADPYWEIERRMRWAERQSPESFALRESVLATPNLVAVFTGHIHTTMTATERGKFLLSVPANKTGEFWSVRIGYSE